MIYASRGSASEAEELFFKTKFTTATARVTVAKCAGHPLLCQQPTLNYLTTGSFRNDLSCSRDRPSLEATNSSVVPALNKPRTTVGFEVTFVSPPPWKGIAIDIVSFRGDSFELVADKLPKIERELLRLSCLNFVLRVSFFFFLRKHSVSSFLFLSFLSMRISVNA